MEKMNNQNNILKIKPKKIEENVFRKYGQIIDLDGRRKKNKGNLFRIVTRERKSTGWRIAYLVVRDKQIDKLEQHPESMESFEPLKGNSILYVSNQKKPNNIEAFILDKPVVLRKGIWHGIVTKSRETHVKITENNQVKMHNYELGFKL